jgi:uncharacterized membrane protein YcaP (DUF421 family)
MNHYLAVAIELVFGFFALFLLTKLLGKNQLSQITPFDFISALILGELLGNAVYDHDTKLTEIIYATTLWGMLIFTLELITQKFTKTRKIFEGQPTIVIHKGKLSYKALKKNHLDINQLQNLIRQKGYFSLQEVEYAILETNGSISVLPKAQYDVPKIQDLNLPTKPVHLPITIILDGRVLHDNMKELGVDNKWLSEQLLANNISNPKEVLFAEWTIDKPLFVMKYN